MKKILMVACNDLGRGGIQNVIMNIVRNLSDEFLFDIVCFSNKKADYDEEFLSFGGHIFRIPFYKGSNSLRRKLDFYIRAPYLSKEIHKIIKNNGPYDIVHCHNMLESGIVLREARRCNVPIRISHAHTAFPNRARFLRKWYIGFLRQLIYRNATELIGCSQYSCQSLFGKHSFSVIFNTVDRRFAEAVITEFKHTSPAVLQVGLFCDNKNQLFTIEVFRYLKNCYPEATLTFIGRAVGADLQRYQKSILVATEKYHIKDSVRFLPADADVLEEMKQADYLILPSHHEGMPVVLLEAQFLGLTCFVSDSISKEADCQGCKYIPLSSGAEHWSEIIASDFYERHGQYQQYDMKQFLPETIAEQYRKLYRGDQ